MRAFTPKQRLFIKNYVIHKNASKAAIEAGYSKKCARQIGRQNLTKVYIAEAIEKLLKVLEYKAEVTAERVIKEIAILAFADSKDFFYIDEDGQKVARRLDEIPEGMTRAIESISEDRVIRENPDGSQIIVHDKVKYKLHSKPRSLEMLCKHLGLYADEKIRLGLSFQSEDGDPVEFVMKVVHTNGTSAEEEKD